MGRKGTVTVVGTSNLKVVPDRADLTIEVNATDSARSGAHDRAARLSAAVAAVLDGHGIPASRRQTAPVVIAEVRDQKTGTVKRHRASVRTSVRLGAGDRLGEIVAAAVAAGADVYGPVWCVGPDNPARLDAYREASRDARAKASAYCEGLELELGPVHSLAEPPGGGFAPMPRAMAALRAAEAEPPVIDLNPGEVDVGASIQVTFLVGPGPVA